MCLCPVDVLIQDITHEAATHTATHVATHIATHTATHTFGGDVFVL